MRSLIDSQGWLKVPLITAIFLTISFWQVQGSGSSAKILVAHRGASSYAPEHTLEAYRLAITQRADYVEQDLQVTREGVLVCLHDLTLERTTNVAAVFANRSRSDERGVKRWHVADFTVVELKQLDAGSWFDAKFRGARIPTFQEAIDVVKGKAGLYPETKSPEVYDKGGFSMERLLVDVLKKNGLDRVGADPKTPIIIQSFSAESLQTFSVELKSRLPLVFLVNSDPGGKWLSFEGLRKVKEFASGIGPAKRLVEQDAGLVKRAHDFGLTVTPYTFRSGDTGRFSDVRQEMHHFLFTLDVDAVFTDNPDQFPRTK